MNFLYVTKKIKIKNAAGDWNRGRATIREGAPLPSTGINQSIINVFLVVGPCVSSLSNQSIKSQLLNMQLIDQSTYTIAYDCLVRLERFCVQFSVNPNKFKGRRFWKPFVLIYTLKNVWLFKIKRRMKILKIPHWDKN